MSLVTESFDAFAAVEYIAAKNGHTHHIGVALNAPHVLARVDLGRWIGDCPACRSARLLSPLRGFWCAGCGLREFDGLELPVDWPAADDLAAIETLLAVRPIENRWWKPGEEIDQLRQENYDHDLPAAGWVPPEETSWPGRA